jgi:hypothetical protein
MSENEAARLAERYAKMSDGELQKIADDLDELTDEARSTLTIEIRKRELSFSVPDVPPSPSDEDWLEVKRFDNVDEAEHAKTTLDAAEIASHLTREDSRFLVDRLISNLLGRVKLIVKPEDLDEALEIVDRPVKYENNLQDWIVLKQFRDLPEATLAKGALGSAGIECHLTDDNMVRLDWFLSNLLGGVKLLVKPDDLHAAEQLLDQPTPEVIEYDDDRTFSQPSCPKCGSFQVRSENAAKGVALASLYLAAVPVPISSRRWVCDGCGSHWTEEI